MNPIFPPSSDKELLSHILPPKREVRQPSSKFLMLSFCSVTGLKRVCIPTSPWFWLHERNDMTDYPGICTDDAPQGCYLWKRSHARHQGSALWTSLPHSTLAVAEAGRRMTFFTPFLVLKNDKNSLWSLTSALPWECRGLGKASSWWVSECTAKSAMGMRGWGRMPKREFL